MLQESMGSLFQRHAVCSWHSGATCLSRWLHMPHFGLSSMRLSRRWFLGAGLAAATIAAARTPPATSKQIGAVAFDAFTLFDARPVFQACEAVAPGKGNELASLWRTRQFEYQWLRALGGRYADFYA